MVTPRNLLVLEKNRGSREAEKLSVGWRCLDPEITIYTRFENHRRTVYRHLDQRKPVWLVSRSVTKFLNAL
jgi:hypothetical protein